MTLIANSGHASTVEESNAGHAMDIPVALPWSQRELPVPSPLFPSVRATRTKIRKGMLDQKKAVSARQRMQSLNVQLMT